MHSLISILTSTTTWETLGLACALFLLCSHHIREWFKKWINSNNTKIQEDIQSATKLEQDAHLLLKQYQTQVLDQQKQLNILKHQNNQELRTLKQNIAQKTTDAIQRQNEATSIHIRLIATEHQQKMMAGILDKFTKSVSTHLKKQKKENMNASIQHLFDALEKNSEILKKV